MKPLFLLFAWLLSFPALGQTAPQDAVETQRIEAVIEAFRTSIIDKDKSRFVGLFLHEGITWQSVRGDDSLRRLRQKQPEAAKVEVDPARGYVSFIDGIVAGKKRFEEKFWNVNIETDGDIASVRFDYSFHAGDSETNRGKEAWQLVNTGDGWKIVSVIWSVHVKPEPSS